MASKLRKFPQLNAAVVAEHQLTARKVRFEILPTHNDEKRSMKVTLIYMALIN